MEEPLYVEVPKDVSGWRAPRGFLSAGEIFGASWRAATGQVGAMFLIGIVHLLVVGAVNGAGIGIILLGPLLAGLYYTIQRGLNTGTYEIGDLFKGFSVFLPAMVAGLLISIFSFVGFLACILPGIIVYWMYQMTFLFMIDRRMDFWPSMEASRKLYFANFWSLTVLYLLAGIINLVGALACYVGLFFTFPLTVIMTTLAYERLVGFEQRGDFEPSVES